MGKNLDCFNEKFKTSKLKIHETDFWIWSLRPHQATLGSGILSLKRECRTFGELKKEEYCDLDNIIKKIEEILKLRFNYDVINYLMLMMVDKHVHFHVIPRYRDSIDMFDIIWKDAAFPAPPILAGDISDDKTLNEILEYIKKGK